MAQLSSERKSIQSGRRAQGFLPDAFGALELLLQAYRRARRAGRNPWDFAIGIENAVACGTSKSALRVLLTLGYVDHAVEQTRPKSAARRFRRAPGASFAKRSCFVLTPLGAKLANRALRQLAIPLWDAARCELRFRGKLVKRLSERATSQEMILSAFQQEGWPRRIDDPFPPSFGRDSKRRLRKAVSRLNRKQTNQLLQFRTDGAGRGVLWDEC